MGAQQLELLARRLDLAHMEDLLTRALRLRNFLAHNYFRERAAVFTTEDGQQRMIEELKCARELFSEVDAEMTKLAREIMRLKGLDSRLDEVHDRPASSGQDDRTYRGRTLPPVAMIAV